MPGYVYKGTQTGTLDPWHTPQTPRRKQCGTKAGHKRHIYHHETPCTECRDAKNAYDRHWRAQRKNTR